MIIKDITEQTLPLATNILPIKKNNVFSIKIDKSIEIVVVPNFGIKNSHQPKLNPKPTVAVRSDKSRQKKSN